jgi:hypothetical protein
LLFLLIVLVLVPARAPAQDGSSEIAWRTTCAGEVRVRGEFVECWMPAEAETPTATLEATATPLPTLTASPTLTPSPTRTATRTPTVAMTTMPLPEANCTRTIISGVASAIGSLQPGDTLCLRGGTYAENITATISGTSASRITIRSYPGETAILKGLQRFTLNYTTISGITFDWNTGAYTDHMLKLNNGVGWTFTGNEARNAKSFACVLIYGSPRDYAFTNNYVHDCASGIDTTRDHDLYVNAPGGVNGLIERNILVNAPGGYNAKLSGSSSGTEGTKNVTFRYNTLVNANRANLLIGSRNNTGNQVYGNLFVGAGDGWNVRLWDMTGGEGTTVHDNLWWGASTFCSDYASVIPCEQVDGGGNVRLDPDLDERFIPQNPAARAYGHTAP